MIIREIDTNNKFATVTLDYDELKCLDNSLYLISKVENIKRDKIFNTVYARIIELFSLVKHGNIPEFELKLMHQLLYESDHLSERMGKGE